MYTLDVKGDYTFVNFYESSPIVYPKNEMNFYLYKRSKSSTSYMIAFSQPLGEILNRKNLTKFRVRIDNLTNEEYLVFSKQGEGVDVKTTTWGKYARRTICNKNVYLYFDDVDGKGKCIRLSEDLSKSNDFATFKILK